LTWWNLIARLIYAEKLPGDRQFWLTRPYRRSSLVAAKALQILLYINIPMLLAGTLIVGVHGAHRSSRLSGLLWIEVLLTAVFILPVAALATLTTGFSQMVFAGIPALLIVMFAMAVPPSPGHMRWTIPISYLVVAFAITALFIVGWQYARRKTALGRALAVAAVILIPLVRLIFPWSADSWIQF
jgi:hypothetical protein